MRYHFKKPELYRCNFGEKYICDHPLFDKCTLFKIKDKGITIVQQRFDMESKSTKWTEIDDYLRDAIYTHNNFLKWFKQRAEEPVNGLYPTFTVRQVMYALRMKPLPRERWETYFDRKRV